MHEFISRLCAVESDLTVSLQNWSGKYIINIGQNENQEARKQNQGGEAGAHFYEMIRLYDSRGAAGRYCHFFEGLLAMESTRHGISPTWHFAQFCTDTLHSSHLIHRCTWYSSRSQIFVQADEDTFGSTHCSLWKSPLKRMGTITHYVAIRYSRWLLWPTNLWLLMMHHTIHKLLKFSLARHPQNLWCFTRTWISAS